MSTQQPSPRPSYGRTPRPSRRRYALKVALAVVAAVAAIGTATGLFFGFLWAVNPMGDEWICSDGEAPAGQDGFYNHCFDDDATLPKGYEWDPFGNRPMPGNCDKDGWIRIERPMPGHRGETEEDCVREGTELPAEWYVVDDD